MTEEMNLPMDLTPTTNDISPKVKTKIKKEKKGKKVKPKKAEYVQERKDLIARLVKSENINWVNELSVSKRLIALFPDIEFWNQFSIPNNIEIGSLRVLYTLGWRKFLQESYNIFSFNKNKEIPQVEIQEVKFGEDKEAIPSGRKTLKDFLR